MTLIRTFPLLLLAGLLLGTAAQAADDASRHVTLKEAEQMVGEALVTEGAGTQVHVTLFGDHDHNLNATDNPVAASVQNVEFKSSSGQVSAMLVMQDGSTNLPPIKLQGRFEEMTDIPVLKKNMDNSAIIQRTDIEMVSYSTRRLRGDTAMSADDLVGKAPKRSIAANRPVREEELVIPADVKKGALVTLKYETGGMLINATGETLEPGAIGSRIRVKNSASSLVVSGTLENNGVVSVSTFPSN